MSKIVLMGPVRTASYFGGVATFNENLAMAFATMGKEVYVLTKQQESPVASFNDNIHVLKNSIKHIKLLKNADIVIASLDYLHYLHLFEKKTLKIYFMHGFFNMSAYGYFGSTLRVGYQKLFIKSADSVLCNSTFTKLINEDMFAIHTDGVVSLGVSFDYIDLIKRLKTSDRVAKSLLYVGRLVKAKNVDKILDAMTNLDDGYVLNIVGDGPELKNLIHKAKVKNINVNFLGRLSADKIVEQYLKTEMFISLNTSEPFGITFLEAALAGCKIICPTTGGQNDIINKYREYIAYEPIYDVENTLEIGRAIRHISKNELHKNLRPVIDDCTYIRVANDILKEARRHETKC